MVTQRPLEALFLVRVQAGQPLHCFFSGSTLGTCFQFSNFPSNAWTKAFRNALKTVAKMSGCGLSNVPENGTFVANRSFGWLRTISVSAPRIASQTNFAGFSALFSLKITM